MKTSTRTVDCFDYIMNTATLYTTLRLAVVDYSKPYRKHQALSFVESAVRNARKDYRKQFAGEVPPSWVTHTVNVEALLAFAKSMPDRFAR